MSCDNEDIKTIYKYLWEGFSLQKIADIKDEKFIRAASLFRGAYRLRGEYLNMLLAIIIKESFYNGLFMPSISEKFPLGPKWSVFRF